MNAVNLANITLIDKMRGRQLQSNTWLKTDVKATTNLQ